MRRTILKGLTAAHFICSEEKKMREEGVLQKAAVQKLIRTTSKSTDLAMATVREGTYVHLTKETSPKLYRILLDVCTILDCDVYPDIYLVRREYPIAIPCSGKGIYIVISTFTVEYYDEDMLYYAFGNAMAMVKAGHVHMSQLMAYMPGGLLTAALKAILLRFIHAADMSSDRGGLLACQSFAAAVRCHILEMGMPPTEARKFFTTDAEAVEFIKGYLTIQKELKEKTASLFTKVAQTMQDLNTIEAPGNQMLQGLLEWYLDPGGYTRIMQMAERRRL